MKLAALKLDDHKHWHLWAGANGYKGFSDGFARTWMPWCWIMAKFFIDWNSWYWLKIC